MNDEPHSMRLIVNGQVNQVSVDPGKPLVDLLRDDLQLRGTHVGCRNGDCGACTVLIDGTPYKSCLVPSHRAAGCAVETLEGLAPEGKLHPVQKIFWESNAFQCGFCLSGNILCTVALLRNKPEAGLADVKEALAGNLCRCTGYQQIMAAAMTACDHARQTSHPADEDPPIDPSSAPMRAA